ncbi:MAG: hypothetical protein AB9866_28350 [Syntrophobacteraceae bacterium]
MLNNKLRFRSTKTRLHLIAAIILVAGLGSAFAIFIAADSVSDNLLVQQFQNSKRYRHDLELVGGKLNVLADRLCRWFDGLWHGRSLAFTVVWITILTSVGVFVAAYHLPAEKDPDARGEQNPDRNV